MKPKLVIELEKRYGVKFQNAGTGSFYVRINRFPVRVSDHFSKFEEKYKMVTGEKSFDFTYASAVRKFETPISYIVCMLEGINPFEGLDAGCVVVHSGLGVMKFLSYDANDKCLICELDGMQKKYFEERFYN